MLTFVKFGWQLNECSISIFCLFPFKIYMYFFIFKRKKKYIYIPQLPKVVFWEENPLDLKSNTQIVIQALLLDSCVNMDKSPEFYMETWQLPHRGWLAATP